MVTIIRNADPEKDVYGDPQVDTDPDETDVDPIYVAPRFSDDVDGHGRDGVVVGLNVAFRANTDIRRTDLVRVDEVVYKIEGEPATWQHPLSSQAEGIVVPLTRAEG